MVKQIRNREDFHNAMSDYIADRETDSANIARGKRGWTGTAKRLVHTQDAICAYCISVLKRGHSIDTCLEALSAGDANLVQRFATFLYYDTNFSSLAGQAFAYADRLADDNDSQQCI